MHEVQERLLNLAKSHDISKTSLHQLARLAGVKHAQTVKYHLRKLVEAGKLRDVGGTMKVVNRGVESGLLSIPVLGSANCGAASRFAEEQVEGFLQVSSRIVSPSRNVFAVRAVGNSMDNARINGTTSIDNGDYAIVQATSEEPNRGDYVLSVIDGCANIKRFYRSEEGTVMLVSESTEQSLHPPMVIHPEDDYRINGKVVQVLKIPKTT